MGGQLCWPLCLRWEPLWAHTSWGSLGMWGEGQHHGGRGLVSGWLRGWRLPSFLFERAGSCHLNLQTSAVCSCSVTCSLLYHKPGVTVCVHRVCVHLGGRVCEGVNVSASQYVVCVVSVYRWRVHMRCGMCSHVHVCTRVLCVYVLCVRPCVWSRRRDQKWEGDAEVRETVGTGSGRGDRPPGSLPRARHLSQWVQSWFLFTRGGVSMWGVKDSRTKLRALPVHSFLPVSRPRQKGGCHKCFEVAPALEGEAGGLRVVKS